MSCPRCLPGSLQSAARVAATVLTRAAVDRGSRDNVTVVIVDLSPMTAAEMEAEAQLSEVRALWVCFLGCDVCIGGLCAQTACGWRV